MEKTYTEENKRKVAAYARVSLETDRLAHSLSAQTEYYTRLIRANPDWELVGIYADSFISGTDASRRSEFRRLVSDCENGRIDLVLCKSISRFARNTVDLLETVRRLKRLGVEVRFEKENINSLSADGELLLTILAGFAQEESRSISDNVKWGLRKRFRSGNVGMQNKSVFGYRYDGEKYVVFEEEAKAVRLIFEEYINGVPLRKIGEKLREEGFKTTRGCDFSHNQINYIVHNEIYAGNIVLQKTYVRDFITHAKAPNRGELPQYRLCGVHEAIVSEKIFAAASEESRRRAGKRQDCCFSGKLICGVCGKPFSRFSNYGKYARWRCRECDNARLKEDSLKRLFNLTDEEIRENLLKAVVYPDGSLNAEYYDGRTQTWQYK